MAVDFKLSGGEELELVAAKLEEAGRGGLRRALNKEIREASKSIVPAVKASISAIPSKHASNASHPGGHLRTRLKNATTLTIYTAGNETNMIVRVDGRRMPPGQGRLPAYMEGTRPRWRHPVFGDREVWVDQASHPYFYKVVEPKSAEVQRRLNQVARDYAFKIS